MIIVLINYIIIIIMYSTRKTPKKKVVKKIIKRKKKKPKKPKTISRDIKQSVKQAVQVIIEAPKQKSRPKGLQPKATSIRDNMFRPSLVQVIREERNNNMDFQLASLVSRLENTLKEPQQLTPERDNRLEILNEVRKKQQERFTRELQDQTQSQQQELRQIRLEQQNLLDDINFKDAMNEPPKIYPTPTEVMNLLNRVEQSRRPPPQEEEKDEFFDPIEESIPVAVRKEPVIKIETASGFVPLEEFSRANLDPIKKDEFKPELNPIKKDEFKTGLDERQAEEKTPTPPQEEEEQVIQIKHPLKKTGVDFYGTKTASFQDKLKFLKKNNLKQVDKNGGLREIMFSVENTENYIKLTKIFKYYGINEKTGDFISGEVV